MKKTTLLLAAFAVVSCQERNESSAQYGEPQEIETKTYEQLEKVNWLMGEWGNTTPEGNLTETWSQLNDSTLTGKTVFVTGADTMFTETIEIMQMNDSLLYTTKVSNQNEGKAVSFKASNVAESQIVFENAKHDFPQKITYNKISADSLVAEISGMKDGKESKESYPMKKK
ncbi:DUF6265 family protein [Flavobacterium enshiense]|uniref:DUF6265 family protein n=1 Tax=Flavobacterium enshiense TaxID=1341165 RepID=UPI00345DD53B